MEFGVWGLGFRVQGRRADLRGFRVVGLRILQPVHSIDTVRANNLLGSAPIHLRNTDCSMETRVQSSVHVVACRESKVPGLDSKFRV